MYKFSVGQHELILDSEEVFLDLTGNGSKKIWVDASNKKSPYAFVWKNKKNVRIHTLIADHRPTGMMVGHLNGNSLDNRKENLKIVSRSENQFNVDRKGKFKRWVTKTKNGKFQARFCMHLGTYVTEAEAHEAALTFFKDNFKNFHVEEKYL